MPAKRRRVASKAAKTSVQNGHIVADEKRKGFNGSYAIYVAYANLAFYAVCQKLHSNAVNEMIREELKGDDKTDFASSFDGLQTFLVAANIMLAPILGLIADLEGSKRVAQIVFGSAVSSSCLAALETSTRSFLASRLPTSLTQPTLASQIAVAMNAPETERTKLLARVGVAAGVGAIVAFNVDAAAIGRTTALALSSFGSFVSLVLVSMTVDEDKISQQHQRKRRKSIWPFFIIMAAKMVFGFSSTAFQATFSLTASKHHKAPLPRIARVSSVSNYLALLTQSLIIVDDDIILMVALTVTAVANVGLGYLLRPFEAFVYVLVISSSLVNALLTAALTRNGDIGLGFALGLNMAANSVVKMIAAQIATNVAAEFGFEAIAGVGVVSAAVVIVLLQICKH